MYRRHRKPFARTDIGIVRAHVFSAKGLVKTYVYDFKSRRDRFECNTLIESSLLNGYAVELVRRKDDNDEL